MTPEPIRSDVPGSLPWHVWHERHPALVRQIKDAHPYPPQALDALDALVEETLHGTVTALPAGPPEWDERVRPYLGRSWLEAPFLWAESYFYRRLLDGVGYFAPGAWHGVDPFAFLKAADLAAPRSYDHLPGLTLAEVVLGAVTGNTGDLGFQIGMRAAGRSSTGGHPLVSDGTPDAVSILRDARHAAIVADNAGGELLADLVLTDRLIDLGSTVTLHVKPHPYFVSDATTTDVVAALRHLDPVGGPAAGLAARLRAAARTGRFAVTTDDLYFSPLAFREAAHLFDGYDTVVFKGDLNYRRLVGDLDHPPQTPFASTVDYLRPAVVALRMLKSDVVVGLDPARVAELDATGDDWRIDGSRGLVQARAAVLT